MRVGWLAGLPSLVVVVGCLPSRATLSANELGCPASEVTISEAPAREGGVLETTDHWEAQCQGRIYYCSQGHAQSQQLASEGNPMGLVLSDQVVCQEVAESPQESANRKGYYAAQARAAARDRQGAPAGAAGFDFGMTIEESQKRCEAAGFAWTSATAAGSCSGAAADVGTVKSVDLAFCDGHACGITIQQTLTDHFATRAVHLKSQLESKYGPAQNTSGRIPELCRDDESFHRCLQAGTLQLSYAWAWSSGEALELAIGKPSPVEEPSVRLMYSQPSGRKAVPPLPRGL